MARIILLIAFVAATALVMTFCDAKPSIASQEDVDEELPEPRGGEIPLSNQEKKKQPKFKHDHKHRAVALIPPKFDAREKWPACKSIADIRDQGQCGTCWAVSTASVISDRICITELAAGKTPSQKYVSALQIITCRDLTRSALDNCNKGGATANAYKWATIQGFITGGNYNSNVGCQPYPVKNEIIPLTCSSNKCTNPDYDKTLPQDTAYVDGYWTSYLEDNPTPAQINENVLKMQQDIMVNGPITASITIWSDFKAWKTSDGVYRGPGPNAEKQEGHAVRIIGWDVDANGIKYWKIANSWTDKRGDKGIYWMEIGKNIIGIEGSPTAPIVVMPNGCGAFCDLPIDHLVRMDASNLKSRAFTFQGNCTTEVTVTADGKISPSGSPQPITQVFIGGPSGPITTWSGAKNATDALTLINAAGESGSCTSVSGSNKIDCTPGHASNSPPVYTMVGADKYSYKTETSSMCIFKAGSSSGSCASLGDKITSKFGQVNTFFNIDNQKVLVCGKDASGKGVCTTLQLADKSVAPAQSIKDISTKCQ